MATLKNAIERFENNAEFERRNNNLQGCLDFRQLAEWLKDYKRLLEQEPIDEWQNGYDRGWEEAEVFYEKEEPTIPCELCGFNTGGFCEYLSVCPAIGKAVSE